MAKVVVDINDLVSVWKNKTNQIANQLGDLSALSTVEDSDIVGAINEINSTARFDSASILGIVGDRYFPVDSADINTNAISTLKLQNGVVKRSKLYNSVNLKIYDSTGVVLKTLYGADSDSA